MPSNRYSTSKIFYRTWMMNSRRYIWLITSITSFKQVIFDCPSENRASLPWWSQLRTELARLFDPVVTPVIVRGKIITQSIWATGLGWDKYIDGADLARAWLTSSNYVFYDGQVWLLRSVLAFHGFSEPGIQACVAVVYTHIQDQEGRA